MEEKILLLGLDLSFNCSGITSVFMENGKVDRIKFDRVMYNNEKSKSGNYNPHEIKNINNSIYRMPVNINADDLIISSDVNTKEQIDSTLQAMICSKAISQILQNHIEYFKPDKIVCSIENYIMPAFGGQNQLKTVGGLITLQAYIRNFVIKYTLAKNIGLNLFTPSPTSTKKFFTNDGKADKKKMEKTFYDIYKGDVLIPKDASGKIDDVIDSFALMCHGYKMFIKHNKLM